MTANLRNVVPRPCRDRFVAVNSKSTEINPKP